MFFMVKKDEKVVPDSENQEKQGVSEDSVVKPSEGQVSDEKLEKPPKMQRIVVDPISGGVHLY